MPSIVINGFRMIMSLLGAIGIGSIAAGIGGYWAGKTSDSVPEGGEKKETSTNILGVIATAIALAIWYAVIGTVKGLNGWVRNLTIVGGFAVITIVGLGAAKDISVTTNPGNT